MSTVRVENWFLVDSQSLEGLGQAELAQAEFVNSSFKATIILNKYESNCLRDWLAQRWKAKSLEGTCVFEVESSKLIISLTISASCLTEAKTKFEHWLKQVCLERKQAIESRR